MSSDLTNTYSTGNSHMDEISLKLDESNVLRFNVRIEGIADRTEKVKTRLIFEGDEISYSFNGTQGDSGDVVFDTPPLKGIMKEGAYETSLEVIVGDKIFVPTKFRSNFEEGVKITVEVKTPIVETRSKAAYRRVIADSLPVVSKVRNEVKAEVKPSIKTESKKISSSRKALGSMPLGELLKMLDES